MVTGVAFYDTAEDDILEFAVIAAKYKGSWVYCKHRLRETLEIPGGHREKTEEGKWSETVDETARRELYEETGALDFQLDRVCVYSVKRSDTAYGEEKETYGIMYYAEIKELGKLPELEIEKVCLLEEEPTAWTYPDIQPFLSKKVKDYLIGI